MQAIVDAVDPELADLLAYDGEVIPMSMDGEYVAKFKVRLVKPSKQIPHGIRYALKMHGPELEGLEDSRYVGFDNAHAVQGSGPARIVCWDHRHRMMSKPVPYDFTSPSDLLSDFFKMANDLLDELGVER